MLSPGGTSPRDLPGHSPVLTLGLVPRDALSAQAGLGGLCRLPSCFPHRRWAKAQVPVLSFHSASKTGSSVGPLTCPRGQAQFAEADCLRGRGGVTQSSHPNRCNSCLQAQGGRNAGWAHCILLGAVCDEREGFATREAGRRSRGRACRR